MNRRLTPIGSWYDKVEGLKRVFLTSKINFLITTLKPCIESGKFPSEQKKANLVPLRKKLKTAKRKLRPISLLPILGKIQDN